MQLAGPERVELEEYADGDSTLLTDLAKGHTPLASHDQALRYYLKATQTSPNESEPYVGLGMIALQLEKPDLARRSLETALDMDPECSAACGGLAMLQQQDGNYPAAFDLYLRCLDIDSDNLFALLGLFQTSCQMGSFGKVIGFLELYLKKHPDDSSVLFCLATLYAREGQLPQARDGLIRVLVLEPDKVEASKLLTNVQIRLIESQS